MFEFQSKVEGVRHNWETHEEHRSNLSGLTVKTFCVVYVVICSVQMVSLQGSSGPRNT